MGDACGKELHFGDCDCDWLYGVLFKDWLIKNYWVRKGIIEIFETLFVFGVLFNANFFNYLTFIRLANNNNGFFINYILLYS